MKRSKTKLKLLDFLQEMETWVKVKSDVKRLASQIDSRDLLTSGDVKDLARLARRWKAGIYDNDPDVLTQELVSLTIKYKSDEQRSRIL